MTIQAAIHHVTSYRYDRLVGLSPQVIRLRPAPHCRTRILNYALTVSPRPHFLNWLQDPQSNWLARVVFPERTDHFTVTVELTAAMDIINPFDFFLEPEAEHFPFDYEPALAAELQPYLRRLALGPDFQRYLAAIPRARRPTTGFLFDINARLQRDIGYLIRLEPGIQTPDETLRKGSGSCRDTAWLLVQLLRHLGLAARFASGYLIQLTPDQKALDGPSGTERDFTDLHAWCEVYLPGAGWVGLDPTSGLFAGEGHIPLACAAEPTAAAPISGALEPCEVAFEHEMSVARVQEAPRVTKPYDAATWARIEALGEQVDGILRQEDVRLTMGGEPTFVALEDMEGAEWNGEALGPTKRGFADRLIRRLRERFAPNGLLHYGQGKWYPGETLPRWAFGLYWRADGEPLWQDPALIAAEDAARPVTAADAQRLAEAIARRLGLDPAHAQPAYEDPEHYRAREETLPPNVEPLDSKLDDAEERRRLARVFGRGLAQPVGSALPLRPLADDAGEPCPGWRSEAWKTRRGRLTLVPGDSPLGFRLPLGALDWLPPAERPRTPERETLQSLPPLPAAAALHRPRPPAKGGGKPVRTALAVEPRDGRLCVFLPPVTHAESYLELVAAVEDAARETGLAVHLEGYPPPHDPRISVIKVTPDPGVIEVNIHPAASWREQVETTEALYEEARLCRLTAEKFMLDGRHAGTGGGNHIVVGGATPLDSPFLRRPDLLMSLVAYWQNHPALSYLFSGLFIGPTSQAPRIDETRHDQLYELEIAFKEIPPRFRGAPAPWLVDRVFRNLLIDATGNTHRAEICIDKLYSPDGPTGRLGLVEFRAFEMPPHARMSLAQALLLRALIARFWRTPYGGGLVRWGTSLHDRFLLPHYVWQDLVEVIEELRAEGFALEAEWFRPHWTFRFPLYGEVSYEGLHLELRQALEPWHVLGEEGAIGGTVRYVDSSLERLQVKVSGLTPGRHRLLVNGQAAPLTGTGRQGEAVAGVRFRAWAAPRSLHPTIAPHAPLTLELWDAWRRRSLGGCTYHVAHPGGRNYDVFPVNANEAEGRRLARFEPFGYTGGVFDPAPPDVHPEFPLTLDLRRFL